MDLFTVVSHELGHVLGPEHSETDDSTMSETLDVGTRMILSTSGLQQELHHPSSGYSVRKLQFPSVR